MNASSLVRFSDRRTSNGKKLFWDTVGEHGLPFRGNEPPLLSADEFEERIVRIPDFQNGFFDVTNQVENKAYQDIMNACYTGWFQITCLMRFWKDTTKHYVEWTEWFLEDGARTPAPLGSVVEYANGQTNTAAGYNAAQAS